MAVSALTAPQTVAYDPTITSSSKKPDSLFDQSSRSRKYAPVSGSLAVAQEMYSSNKLSFQYQSKDGDTVSLSMESTQYQSQTIAVNFDNLSSEDQQKLVQKIFDEFDKLKKETMAAYLKGIGVDVNDQAATAGTEETSNDSEIPGLPEYWNAENTSQRIVDFALQFADASGLSKEDFAQQIKAAIEAGFGLARDAFGEMPDAIGKLVDNTHSLVMDKIDAWVKGGVQAAVGQAA